MILSDPVAVNTGDSPTGEDDDLTDTCREHRARYRDCIQQIRLWFGLLESEVSEALEPRGCGNNIRYIVALGLKTSNRRAISRPQNEIMSRCLTLLGDSTR